MHQIDVTDNNASPLTTSLIFNITIVDVNDPPLLSSPNVTSVPENSPLGSTSYQFRYVDDENHAVAYSIVGGNLNTGVYPPVTPSAAFVVGTASGVLSPASILNFELLPQYDLRMLLTDTGSPPVTTAVTLRVNILDRNDVYVWGATPHTHRPCDCVAWGLAGMREWLAAGLWWSCDEVCEAWGGASVRVRVYRVSCVWASCGCVAL